MNKKWHRIIMSIIYVCAITLIVWAVLLQAEEPSETIEGIVPISDVSQKVDEDVTVVVVSENTEISVIENATKENASLIEHRTETVQPSTQKTTDKTPTPATTVTTTKTIAWGTARDFDVAYVEQEANRYVAQFEGVELDNTLTPQNASWTLVVSSYGQPSEQIFLNRIKDSALYQYQKCVESGHLNYDEPLRMYVKADPSYNEIVQETYYDFYILYI